MASSCNVPCVKRNFFFLLTGVGKGVFNIFSGSLLFINSSTPFIILGWAMIASGLIFIFLSKVKNMTDDDLNRAISLYADGNKKQMKAAATNAFMNNKDKIAKAAYDNREVIAQVAYEHKDVIAEVAYENKDAIAEAYI
mmetsp:Transcript_16079/g.24978  ORF Transcript_16079/g.24978 Transcript_16079/m.24978 type:complete len:139 (-) Transcript_16079:167-583(-)